jgi:hypothetical protein
MSSGKNKSISNVKTMMQDNIIRQLNLKITNLIHVLVSKPKLEWNSHAWFIKQSSLVVLFKYSTTSSGPAIVAEEGFIL